MGVTDYKSTMKIQEIWCSVPVFVVLWCQRDWKSRELSSRLTWRPLWPWGLACPSLKTAWAASSLACSRSRRSETSYASCTSMATNSTACSKTACQVTRKVRFRFHFGPKAMWNTDGLKGSACLFLQTNHIFARSKQLISFIKSCTR